MNTERAQQYVGLYRQFMATIPAHEWREIYDRTVRMWMTLTEQEKLIVKEMLDANEG